MSKVESAISWMEKTANDDIHGYSQEKRWGPDYDCSSAVITAWEQAGVKVKTAGATYTGNMYGIFIKNGFKDVTSQVTLSSGAGLKRGDVLLNKKRHTAMYCGNGKEVEASINEKGKATGGQTGDQTGKEFLIRSYRNYPWDCVLRYEEGGSSEKKTKTTATTKSGSYFEKGHEKGQRVVVTATSGLKMRTDATTSAKIVGILAKNSALMWYGYYKIDSKGDKWLFVQNPKTGRTGYCHSGWLK